MRLHPRALRLPGAIARDIGIAIVSGRYRPGDLLSGEIASCERLDVSRTAYREAICILAAKGLIDARPKVGTSVTSRDKWNMLDPEVLVWTLEGEPDREMVECLYEMRDAVESAAAALAAARRSPEHLNAMQTALDEMAHYTLATEAGRQGDQDFHAALLKATRNPYFISLTTGVIAAVDATTEYKQRERTLKRDAVPDHARVFEAIADGDPERAQNEMSTLIRLALEDIKEQMSLRRRRPASRLAPPSR